MEKVIENNVNNDVLLYVVKSYSPANIDNVLDEWIRFLSYIKSEELLFINELERKKIELLTTAELEQYSKIKNKKEMAKLFIKYKNKDCSREEYDIVLKYMDNQLEKFMQDSLTEEEIKHSNKILFEFSKMSQFELKDYIDNQMINYDSLTILEAYILYKVKEIKYNKENNEVIDKIKSDQIERQISLKKSLIRDYAIDTL